MPRQSMLFHARIHTVVIPVSDLEASRTWYESCRLGTEVLHDRTERLTVLDLGSGTRIALLEMPRGFARSTAPHCPYVIVEAADAAEFHQSLEAAGAAPGPLDCHGRARVFVLRDPDGNLFEISDLGAARAAGDPAAD